MKKFGIDALRNVALAGHGGAGKTSLVEACLFDAGAVDRPGRVEDGTTVSDFDPDEQRRHMSINVSLAPLAWREQKINLIDSPGYTDFVGEVASAVRVADTMVLVVAAPSGVEVGTEVAWGLAEDAHLPRVVFVNKMDRENADFGRCLDQLRAAFGKTCVPLQVPIGAQDSFSGVVDVVHRQAYTGTGRDVKPSPIPGDLEATVEQYRDMLMECAAESDDDLIAKYLDGEPLTDDELTRGLIGSIRSRACVPVLCGSAIRNVGVQPLLDELSGYVPSPADRLPAQVTNPETIQPTNRQPVVAESIASLG